MVVAIATWSLVVTPGARVTQEVFRDFKITNAALGAKLEDQKARSTLKVTYEPPPLSDLDSDEENSPKKSPQKKAKKKEIALCSLTPGTIEQAALDVTFLEEDVVEFEVVGKNSIHLFGNYVDQAPLSTDLPPDFSDEESVDLREVSSDVEINPDELDLDGLDDGDRFEEIEDKAAAGKKHPRDSDAPEADVSMTSAKKANKKLKGESGSAVPVNTETETETKANGEAKESKKHKKRDKKKVKGDGKSDVEAASGGEGKASKTASPLKEMSGGLKIRDVKVGSGKEAKAGNAVSMRYIGKLPNGTVFDSNTKGKPFTFRLGKGEVIKGWDQGVAGMQVGGERLLIIPPPLGYGNKAQSGIPPSSTLHFECKLLEIK